MMTDGGSSEAWWSGSAEALLVSLASRGEGLAAAEAEARLREHGANAVDEQRQSTTLRLLLRQFASPLVLVLVLGAVISLFLREFADAAIILAIVLGSTLLGFVQEYRAGAAVAELRRRLALSARVLRDGRLQTLPARDIVPGDIVELAAGHLVPADGRVLLASDFLVSEASLTGESFPVEKRPGSVAAGAPLAARSNSVFLGTSVRSGTARVLVVRTGRDTLYGAIAARLNARPPETEFQRGVRQFGMLLVRVMLFIVLFVLAVNQFLGRPALESLLFAVALAVGMTPELLPAIVSVTLSRGARAMAGKGVIIRRLEAIENLGSMDILCTDKTGTLTLGAMSLGAAVDADGAQSAEVLQLAYLNAALETGIDNPLDEAIARAGATAGLSTEGFAKIDEIPYDFLRKRLTIVVAGAGDGGSHRIITKGALPNVLAACATLLREGAETPLDGSARQRIEAWFRQKGAEGCRVLGVATKRVAAQARYGRGDEQGLAFAGFLVFVDPPKPEAATAIRHLGELGVRVKIISGDNRYVTAHVAAAIGLDPGALLTGEEIARMRDESLWNLAEKTDLFVEVDPQQKERIVRALQRTGHAVGFLGDGINDAPALHAADVGISVDQAVDVARESADVVLLRPDLDVLRGGVEEGRRTFANTLKYISISTSANFGNMVSMALMTPLLPFLPLAAKQILLNNFLSDIPSIAISTDTVDGDKIERVQRWNIADVRRFMIVFGLISSCFDLLTFALLFHVFAADEATFQTAWFVVSVLTELAVLLVLRTQGPALRSRPSPLLLGAALAVGALVVALPYLGRAVDALGFVPLSWQVMAAMAGVVAGYVACTELAKLGVFHRAQRRHERGAGKNAPRGGV